MRTFRIWPQPEKQTLPAEQIHNDWHSIQTPFGNTQLGQRRGEGNSQRPETREQNPKRRRVAPVSYCDSHSSSPPAGPAYFCSLSGSANRGSYSEAAKLEEGGEISSCLGPRGQHPRHTSASSAAQAPLPQAPDESGLQIPSTSEPASSSPSQGHWCQQMGTPLHSLSFSSIEPHLQLANIYVSIILTFFFCSPNPRGDSCSPPFLPHHDLLFLLHQSLTLSVKITGVAQSPGRTLTDTAGGPDVASALVLTPGGTHSLTVKGPRGWWRQTRSLSSKKKNSILETISNSRRPGPLLHG